MATEIFGFNPHYYKRMRNGVALQKIGRNGISVVNSVVRHNDFHLRKNEVYEDVI